MHNVVDFQVGPSRARRSKDRSPDGAQILWFTGVRYEREVEIEPPSFIPEAMPFETPTSVGASRSEAALDLATH